MDGRELILELIIVIISTLHIHFCVVLAGENHVLHPIPVEDYMMSHEHRLTATHQMSNAIEGMVREGISYDKLVDNE